MKKEHFLELAKKRMLVLDGAMGTMLHKAGFTTGCAAELNIRNPELIKAIHKSYADAGADMILTNTFSANRRELGKYGIGNKTAEINKAAVKIARDSAPGCIIAGDVGPLGTYLEPLGELSFDDAYEMFSEQITALNEADLLIIETISDIKELKAAVLAAKDHSSLPIMTSMSFQDGRTATGTDVESYTVIMDAMGVDAIGANCSEGPEGLLEVAKIIAKNTDKPVLIEPNAGIPKIIDGKTVFMQSPDDFGKYAEKFHKLGVNMLGGCCGTTPEHIKRIAERLKNKKPVKRIFVEKTKLSSRTKTVTVEGKTLVVGERINPTGKKHFQDELKEGKTSYIQEQALLQAQQGASLLDINVGVAGADEKNNLPKAVEIVQRITDLPIVIDTSSHEALEPALKKADGKPLINSVNGSEKSLKAVLPLARKYGAAIIALTLDEKGIPETKEERISIARRIIEEASRAGIKKQDIIVDCLTLTIATNPGNEKIILESLKDIKRLGYKTILGISNISHGLPNRSEINSKFLTKAIHNGLDLAIINPTDNILQENTDIEIFKVKKIKKEDYLNLPIEKQLYNAILHGDEDNILELIEKGLESINALKINDTLIDALNEVGDRFNKKEYFLPQVIASANAMKKAFARLKEALKKEGGKEKGIVLFATVENDYHDIGKNIVMALLECHNYKIIDLGKSVPKEKIVEAVKEYEPDLVGLSALMTTTITEMEKVIKELREKDIKTPVIIGGAVVTDDYAKQIKAAYSKSAVSAVKKVSELIG
ncbi:homocysteine S-methyltransferase family protein [Candidatus Woesearchaeota archaeon]|nr:homocysteine S-methyltransferase family protein [Candidatus Woesearchaeota archaeon]